MSGGRVINVRGTGNGEEIFTVAVPGVVTMGATGATVTDGSATAPLPPMLYNGATYDIQRNNVQGTLLASAARTSTTVTANQTNYNARGVAVSLNVTVASGTGGLQVRIFAMDPVSGAAIYIMALPTAVIATGSTLYTVYPGISNSNSFGINYALTRMWGVSVIHGDASSYTYSLGYSYIV